MLQVLYIDDEPDLLFLCKNYLEDTGEFSVDIVPSTSEGIAMFKEKSYDAVVSDYQMRGGDGLFLLKTLRSEGSTVPFILFTGRGREEVAIEALNSGADYYLQKGGEPESQFAELSHKIHLSVEKRKTEETLREKNEYLTNLIRYASNLIVIWDADFHITQVNRAFENLTGFSEAEVLGKDLALLFPSTTRADSIDLTTRTLFGEKWDAVEIPLKTKAGEERIILWNSANIYARDGKTLLSTIAQGTDITERKVAEDRLKVAYEDLTQSEEELRQNYESLAELQRDLGEAYERLTATEEELREQYENLEKSQQAYQEQSEFLNTLIETIPTPVYYKDTEGRFIGCNQEMELVIGVPREKIIGKTIFDIVDKEEAEIHAASDKEIYYHNLPVQYQMHIQGTPGRDVIFFKAPFLSASGTVGGLIGVVLDITEQKRVEHALRENEARLALALNSARMGVWQWDIVSNHRTFAPETCHLLGINPEQFRGTPDDFFSHVHPDDRGILHSAMKRTLEEDVLYEPEYRVIWPDGSIHYLTARGMVVRDKEGKPLRVNGLLWDISSRKELEEKVRESEENYRRIVDTAEEGIWQMDRDFVISYVNPKVSSLLGYSEEEIIGKPMSRFLLQEDLLDHAIHMEKRRSGLGDFYERRFVRKDGKVVWMQIAASAIMDSEGNFNGSFAMLTDITQRKAVEEELRESETRFRALIQNATDIIRILDKDGIILYDSPSSVKILGYPHGFFLGKSPFEFIHPEDRDRVRDSLQEVYEKKNPGLPTEFRIRKSDGSYVYVESVGINLLEVPGVDGVVVTTHLIDERKKVEQTLRKNQIQLANAMDLSHLVNWEFDLSANLFFFDDRFYALYGTTAEREGGNYLSPEEYAKRFIHPDDIHLVEEAVQGLDSVTDPLYFYQTGHRIIRRDGVVRHISVRFAVVLGESGKVVKTYGANQDVTEWRVAEEQLKHFNEELEEKVLLRTRELEHSLKERTILVQEIHHRVKNNLQIIVSLIRLQQRQLFDPSAKNALLDSESRVRSMALVHEKLYRSEDVTHINLTDYISSLVLSVSNMYRADPGQVKIISSLDTISLDIHRAIPLGLLMNELVTNSFKYAFPEGRKGEIRISGTVSDGQIVIIIQDNGIGIPKEVDEKNGTTLGLHLVNTLVEQLRGTITHDPGIPGTHFKITIPIEEQRGKTE